MENILKKFFGSLWALAIFFAWVCGIALIFSIVPPTASLVETIIGTLIAAAAGTFGAQAVIEKTKRKEALVEEIRNTNAAIIIALDIFNAAYALKKQHVNNLKKDHDAQQEVIDKAILSSGPVVLCKYQENLGTLSPIFAATDALQKQVFEKISVIGRPLALTMQVIRNVVFK